MSGLQEENDGLPHEVIITETEVVGMMEPTISYESDNGDNTDIVTQASSSNHLRVPGLRLKTSFQSISTQSEVSCAGSWDNASEAYSPNTDNGCEDDGSSRDMLGKTYLHDSHSLESNPDIRSPIQDTIITQAVSGASDSLYALSKVAELLEHVLGYLTPSDITNLQLV